MEKTDLQRIDEVFEGQIRMLDDLEKSTKTIPASKELDEKILNIISLKSRLYNTKLRFKEIFT